MARLQPNREAWLNYVAQQMAPMFAALDAPLPATVRIAIGFTSTGRRGKAIGECWDNASSADGHFEIFIRPDLAHAADAMPAQIAAILAHELVHAAVGIEAGHKGRFRKVAKGIGLEGPMRSTTPGADFLAAIAPILAAAGPLPHARLDSAVATTIRKKQGTRLVKCQCATCAYTVRTARKWIVEVGPPHCPQHGAMIAELDADDGEEIEEQGEGEAA